MPPSDHIVTELPDPWLYVDEIAHRTMNDYAFMLAAIDCAAGDLIDPNSLRVLDEVRARLKAGAYAHRLLRPPRARVVRRLDEDMERLCVALSSLMPPDQTIGLTLCCEPVEFDARRSWQACLIVSELVTNAVKHSFRGGDVGEVAIEVRRIGAELRLVVSDNGSACEVASLGRGSGIVSGLVEQLGGVLWRKHTPTGSTIVVSCPAEDDFGRL